MSFNMPCRDIAALKPKAQEACRLFLEECKKAGLNVIVTQTLRTAEYQNSLYQQGRTKPGVIVTGCDGYRSKSNHQDGMAWDICNNKKGDEYNKAVLNKAGDIGKRLGIEWGGGWAIGDTPHFQISNAWKAPAKEDTELNTAVNKLIAAGAKFNAVNWNRLDRMDIRFAQLLIERLGAFLGGTTNYYSAVDLLVSKKVITDRDLWDRKVFKPEYIRVVLIRVAALI